MGQRSAGPFANNNKDLFLSGSDLNLSRLDFPSDATWAPPNGSYLGQVTFTRCPISLPVPVGLDTALFRYLHFSSRLVTTSPDGTELPLGASTKKLIVLIHGWNPGSDPDGYTGVEFASLESQLKSQLANAPDWKLLKYHWEADADTGPIWATTDNQGIDIGALAVGAVDNGTK